MELFKYIVRFFYRIRWWMVIFPCIAGVIAWFMTRDLEKTYDVKTTIFTGIISGYNVDVTDSRNAGVHLSNLMNIITTERTLKIVSLKLLARALENVKTKDLGEVGDMLAGVVTELKSFDEEEEEKGIFGFFKKGGNKLANMKAKYDKAEVNVNRICDALEGHQIQLMKDIAMLDKMYELNTTYFKELSMYIAAGKKKLQDVATTELPELEAKAARSGLPEDAQAVNDLNALCNRFEKKIHDLELTRTISLQMAPQIRLVQSNDTVMSEKIQSTLVNTIPLWKSQMVLAIGVENSSRAAKAQREVTDMTNELLRKNAEKLKLATVETAKESERGIVDIETLKATNESLISTLDEVMKIQQEGKEKRRTAEAELNRIENELKQKLLEIR